MLVKFSAQSNFAFTIIRSERQFGNDEILLMGMLCVGGSLDVLMMKRAAVEEPSPVP